MSAPDPSTRVENAALVEQLLRFQGGAREQLEPMLQALRDAVLLMATREGRPEDEAPPDGSAPYDGTVVQVHAVITPEGVSALSLFTDVAALRACVGDDWDPSPQTGESAFEHALSGAYLGGAVIDPAGPRVVFPLPLGALADLLQRTRPRPA